jgi:hypothetical protein
MTGLYRCSPSSFGGSFITSSASLESIPPVQAHCDKMGVVSHNKNLTRSLPDKAQANGFVCVGSIVVGLAFQ